jgi:hypothetical protein
MAESGYSPGVSARLLLPIGLVFVAAACGGQVSGGSGSKTSSGLYGKVLISPAEPVCRQGEPCGRPAAGYTLVFSDNGEIAGRTKTDKQGHYRIELGPGRYTIGLPSERAIKGFTPPAATVPSGRYAKLDFSLDIGIR